MGGGGVKVTVKGSMEVLSIEIEKDLLNEEEKETLQDLIVCTVNDALKKAENDDSRPTIIRVENETPKFVSVLSGKINTVFDLDEVLK